ncbi:MAG: toll/interleukin-1 receptor domain-containing protein [Chloroflexi bacterium]|nr:toll/interleukin-1 receptor domain-containing protein [Chloroflexota bacterium]
MSTKRKENGKIFISYRRADARGVAGRLGDSLGQYFGDNRVFRDIEDIAGGADFGDVIKQNLANADAVIVLMGEKWLSITDSDGNRRLDDPNDWVAEEISLAIQSGIPVFPVLIENTPMPRAEELPEKLKPLLRYNALSISDNRWKFDVLRLGKIISFDIPSASEKILDRVRAAISFALFAALTFVAATISWNSFQENPILLELWQSGAPFVVIISSALLLASVLNLVDKDKQRYIYASIITGAVGSLIFFISLVFLERPQEPMVIFFGGTLITTLMFAFMNMSGFKAK